MSQTDYVDRSRTAATDEVRKAAEAVTRSVKTRRLAAELLEVGYQYQFERDRGAPRRSVESLIDAMLAEGASTSDAD